MQVTFQNVDCPEAVQLGLLEADAGKNNSV